MNTLAKMRGVSLILFLYYRPQMYAYQPWGPPKRAPMFLKKFLWTLSL